MLPAHKHTEQEKAPVLFLMNNVTKLDPTRTLSLRKKFVSQMQKRFRRLRAEISDAVYTKDCFGLKRSSSRKLMSLADSGLTTGAFSFTRSDEKINAFMDWLEKKVDHDILEVSYRKQIGTGVSDRWTDMYIQHAYKKGLSDAQKKLKRAGFDEPHSGYNMDGAFYSPVHADRVGLLYTRTYAGLKKITSEMDAVISDQLAEGMARGDHPWTLAKRLTRTIELPRVTVAIPGVGPRRLTSLQRAKMLARTEMIRAHHVATIQEYENWGVEGVKVVAEWLTAGNPCPECEALSMEGDINYKGAMYYSLDEIMGMIPVHPNCRCTTLPVDMTGEKVKMGG